MQTFKKKKTQEKASSLINFTNNQETKGNLEAWFMSKNNSLI